MSYDQVIQNFAKRKVNRNAESVTWASHNVFCENDTLYSYGRHFPLARYLGERGGRPFFLKNDDQYSDSTSYHQGITKERCHGVSVSRNALAKAEIPFENITLNNVLHCKPDARWTTGSLVLQHEGDFYLCGCDERKYFVSQLPDRPAGVGHAYRTLMPKAVRQAIRRGLEVRRQGEFFFVDSGDARTVASKMGVSMKDFWRHVKALPLPPRDPPPEKISRLYQLELRNRHVCRQVFVLDHGIYATGRVYHRFGKRATNHHRPLDLGDRWWQVYQNTELACWSCGR